jgi:hypothetical protein
MPTVRRATVRRSQHLKVLEDAGLVRGEIDGPRVCYCVEPRTLRRLESLVGSLSSCVGAREGDEQGAPQPLRREPAGVLATRERAEHLARVSSSGSRMGLGTVEALARMADMSRENLQRLQVLRGAGLLEATKEGPFVTYRS